MKKLILPILIGLYLLSATQLIYAQEKTGPNIIFEIETTLPQQTVEQHAPSGIMAKLIQYDELSRVYISRRDSTFKLRSEFHFASQDKFRNWYQSKEVTNLLKKWREGAKYWRSDYKKFRNTN